MKLLLPFSLLTTCLLGCASAPKVPAESAPLINHTTQSCPTTKVPSAARFMDLAELQLARLTEAVPRAFAPKARRPAPDQLHIAIDLRDPLLAESPVLIYTVFPSMPVDLHLTATPAASDSLSITWDLYYLGKDPLPNGFIFSPEHFDSLTRSFTTMIATTTP